MNIVTFLEKNGDSQNGLLIFIGKTHSENNMEIVKAFVENFSQQQRQTLEIVEDFSCEDKNLRIFWDLAMFPHVTFIFLHVSSFS